MWADEVVKNQQDISLSTFQHHHLHDHNNHHVSIHTLYTCIVERSLGQLMTIDSSFSSTDLDWKFLLKTYRVEEFCEFGEVVPPASIHHLIFISCLLFVFFFCNIATKLALSMRQMDDKRKIHFNMLYNINKEGKQWRWLWRFIKYSYAIQSALIKIVRVADYIHISFKISWKKQSWVYELKIYSWF